MKYQHIVRAEFLERPNRFVAHVRLDGRTEVVHVKNTGRCRELLIPGATVYLEKSENTARSTAYDLVAVEKKGHLINMDSQAPNKVVEEWLRSGAFLPAPLLVYPEKTWGNSRFDFYVESGEERVFIEVKGVTLEEDGEVRFPDAPSERALKHLEELIRAKKEGYRAMVLFVVQMEGVRHFLPNADTHPAFGELLERAAEEGVEVFAYDCKVTSDSLLLHQPVPVYLSRAQLDRSRRREKLAKIPAPLLDWYYGNRRILPWREEPTPYRVWVSEIMLQQTRVEAVKPYFDRFMKALPDIASLAAAPEETLLKLWEGLGYYNRVRNLQKAAIQIMEEYDGRMPDTYEALCSLKGIGSYTAGAISSIAYGKANPAVDGNVLRVISRITVDDRLISESKVRVSVEEDLRQIIPESCPGDFNQAMMELGACVCIPNGEPHCEECPLRELCAACREGTWMDYPRKARPKARTIEEKTVLVIRDAERTVIRKRGERGLLAGMYEFPSLDGYRTAEEVTRYLADNGLKSLRILPLEDAKHIFTHKEWHMKGYMVRVDELETKETGPDSADWLYIEPEETKERYPIPSAFAAYTRSLNMRLGKDREDLQ